MLFELDKVYRTRDGREAVLIGRRPPHSRLYPLIWAEGRSRTAIHGRVWGTDIDGRVNTRFEHHDDITETT